MQQFLIDKIYAAVADDFNLKKILNFGGTEATLDKAFDAVFAIVKLALDIATLVGFIMILYASLLYVISVGDEGKIDTAKKTLIWSIVGTVIVALSTFIVNFVDKSLH